ncbi:MAG: hypothetical protein ACYCY8_11565 [Burkholderiales bacterium]
MTPENAMKLYSAFPRLYRGKDRSLHESLMSWGFDCGDGWFDLIWKLSGDIEDVARKEGLDPCSYDWPEAMQVKAKFGTLRFHVRNSNDQIKNLIDKASEESGRIYESNGQTRSQEPDLVWKEGNAA